MSAETTQLLALLREAGDEAVTLDELAVVGVRDPAGALQALEEAGHAVQRVHEHPERGRTVTCVRLARPGEPDPEPAPAEAAVPVAPAPVAPLVVVAPPAPVAAPAPVAPPVAVATRAPAGPLVPAAPRRPGRLLAGAAAGVLLLVLLRALSGRRR